ncbi:hypothetical protein HK099_002773 [Clydaea vesicula]|uniref:Velvet domain-containing protein n=1 Tax=Clydaea vesicula TaxID=447962 RepID=A0AAD5U2L0_9FUNG|nr:hypothetical protein HK099_002773 [Clydaea vesicula]
MQSRNEFEDDYHNNSFCNQDYLNSEITNNSYCTLTCLDKILLDSNEVIKSSNGFLKDQNEELVESTKRKRTEGSYSNKEKEYTVIWRQKPVHARMSGNGAKERRTIDPPPILELMEYVNGNLMPIIEENCFTHMRAALYSPDGTISLEELQRGMLKNKATLVESSAQPNFDFPEKSAHEIHEISNQRGDLTASIDSTTDLSIETIPSKIKEIKKNRKYKIIWRQRPIHGRMSGNVGTERRTIPIIELLELKENGEFMPITEENIFTSMRASLYDAEGKTCLNNAQTNVSKDFPNILGDTVECSVILYDEFDRLGTFFVFKDLSVRSPGNYTIKFTLYDLESDVAPYGQLASKKSLINVLLAPITIYKPKDFPGTLNSSALTKAFKKQDQFFSNNDRHCVSTAQQHPQYQSNANNASEINEQNSVLVQSSRRKMNEGLIPERKKKYAVIWRQKPVHARMSGNGAKERRTIDPPPILELLELNLFSSVQDNCFTHMRAALYTADGKKSLESLPRERSKNQAILVGDLIEYSRVLFDDLRRTGTFFQKRSDTHRGQLASKKPFQFQIFSPPVKVLSPKDFPGMLESSNISRVFNNQGLKLTIKNKENN